VGREKTSAGFSYCISLIAKGVRTTAITRAAKWSPNPGKPRLAARLLNNPVATNAKVPAKIKSLNMATHEASVCLSRARSSTSRANAAPGEANTLLRLRKQLSHGCLCWLQNNTECKLSLHFAFGAPADARSGPFATAVRSAGETQRRRPRAPGSGHLAGHLRHPFGRTKTAHPTPGGRPRKPRGKSLDHLSSLKENCDSVDKLYGMCSRAPRHLLGQAGPRV
jgi:hypothetical protein